MAAVMYSIEEKGDEIQAIKPEVIGHKVQPFVQLKEKYQYFDMARITKNLEFFERDFTSAKQLVKEKRVVLEEVEVGYRQSLHGSVICGFARGAYEDGRYSRQVSIIFDRDSILKAECDVSGCNGTYDNNIISAER